MARRVTRSPADDGLVTGALVPVQVDRGQDRAVSVEPTVWVHHDLRDAPVD